MDTERFNEIVRQQKDLLDEESELRERHSEKLGEPTSGVHKSAHGNGRAFDTLEGVKAHKRLCKDLDRVYQKKTRLAVDALTEGFPEGFFIRVEGPEVADEEASGVILTQYHDAPGKPYILEFKGWSTVLGSR